MDDKDNIRVDLLKFRRKAYLSYPEGSPQRKTFLKTILENELRLTEKEIPNEFLNLLLEGDKSLLRGSVAKFLGLFAAALFCVFLFLLTHTTTKWSFFLLIPGGASLALGIEYLTEYWRFRKSVNIVKQYSNDMKQHMNKISNDIKRLEGPHGY